MSFLKYLAENLEQVEDLDQVKKALTREETIRTAIAETGETREVVTEMLGAMDSMAEEAVLNLCKGAPTTLLDALTRYRDQVGRSEEIIDRDGIMEDLSALINHRWSGPAETAHKADYVASSEPDGINFHQGGV